MKTIKSRSIDLNKISLLNNFSREFVSNTDLTVDDAMAKLKDIIQSSSYSSKLIYFAQELVLHFSQDF